MSRPTVPSLITLQALGPIELSFAVREFCDADVIPPLRAIAALQSSPENAAQLILETLLHTYPEYTGEKSIHARTLTNAVIMLGKIGDVSFVRELLELCSSDHFGLLCRNQCPDPVVRMMGELIPDIATWGELFENNISGLGDRLLLRALPLIVYRRSACRKTASRMLVESLSEFDASYSRELAAEIVQSLLALASPESLPDILRLNAGGPDPLHESEILECFSRGELHIESTRERLETLRLGDPVEEMLKLQPAVLADAPPMPQSLQELRQLMDADRGDLLARIPLCRVLLRSPDLAVPLLESYLADALQTGREEHAPPNCGPGIALLLLIELNSPQLLRLLLPAVHAKGSECIDEYDAFVGRMWRSLVARTAAAPEFVVEWIHRFVDQPQLAAELVTGLALSVLEGCVEGSHCQQLLRTLFNDLTRTKETCEGSLANVVSEMLALLGDVEFFNSLAGDPRLEWPQLLLTADIGKQWRTGDKVLSEWRKEFAITWLVEQRFRGTIPWIHERVDRKLLRKRYAGPSNDDGHIDARNLFRQMEAAMLGETKLARDEGPYSVDSARPGAAPPVATIRNTAKVGRNDPCPCGSGRKYKKCCGNT
ncbi:MAG: SEC-C metal-binding domain-containing protein [Planctomycetota bacterium]